MSYYRPCPRCGSNLDPGERCDCKEKAASGVQDRKAANQNYPRQLYHIEGALSNVPVYIPTYCRRCRR